MQNNIYDSIRKILNKIPFNILDRLNCRELYTILSENKISAQVRD